MRRRGFDGEFINRMHGVIAGEDAHFHFHPSIRVAVANKLPFPLQCGCEYERERQWQVEPEPILEKPILDRAQKIRTTQCKCSIVKRDVGSYNDYYARTSGMAH
jgi:hypothetical protein